MIPRHTDTTWLTVPMHGSVTSLEISVVANSDSLTNYDTHFVTKCGSVLPLVIKTLTLPSLEMPSGEHQ